uniref:Ig-like domain-containing protein n=1 Tax=Sparus aurata TaxID=8175 RepID=A0A671TLQ4_SPAAU
TCVVNVTQTSYQAEENHNITLEWTFTTTADTSPDSLYIFCEMKTDHKVLVPESRDQQFVGRVQWDKDVLRDGRLRLYVSRLRTEDSGQYLCDVRTNYGGDFGDCWLSVSGKSVDE